MFVKINFQLSFSFLPEASRKAFFRTSEEQFGMLIKNVLLSVPATLFPFWDCKDAPLLRIMQLRTRNTFVFHPKSLIMNRHNFIEMQAGAGFE